MAGSRSGRAGEIARLQALIDSMPSGADGGASDAGASRPAAGSPARPDGGIAGGAWSDRAGAPEKEAYGRIVELCSHHEFCRAKMADRLTREGVAPDALRRALDHAEEVSLIDDARWGEMRAAALMRRGMGIPGIERELRGNGIEPDRVAGWPEEFSERFGDELSRAALVLRGKPPRSKDPRASAYARLLRKGYDPSVAARASMLWLERDRDAGS